MKTHSGYLLNEPPINFYSSLALAFGSDEAIIIQQVRYWMIINSQDQSKLQTHFIDGRWWTYNTFDQWSDTFIWMSLRTIKTKFAKLKKQGVLLQGFFHKDPRNRTAWYSINFDKLDRLVSAAVKKHNITGQDLDKPLLVPNEWAKEMGLDSSILLSTLVKDQWDFSLTIPRLYSSVFQEIHNLSSDKISFWEKVQGCSRRTKYSILKQLQDDGWIERVKQDPIAIRDQLVKCKTGQTFKSFDRKACDWCLGHTLILHEHHFPITKSEGGVDVVKICPNCHAEYHALEDERFFRFSQKLADVSGVSLAGGVA